MSLRKTFAENVKLFRKQKEFTQAQLAELCDISTIYMGEIENEKKFPSVDIIERLAIALGIRPYILFYETKTSIEEEKSLAIKWNQEKKDQILKEIFESVQKILERN